jgi:chemotaxis receptor (MCP) glutamine deamidase CheD
MERGNANGEDLMKVGERNIKWVKRTMMRKDI